MNICPNCKASVDEQFKFCHVCGTEIKPFDTQEASVQDDINSTSSPEGSLYTSTVTQDNSKTVNAKSIAGMALGVSGLSFGVLGIFYTVFFLFMSVSGLRVGYPGFILGIMMTMLSAPLSVIGLVLSVKELTYDKTNTFSRIGKGIGIVAAVLCVVVMLFAFMCLI